MMARKITPHMEGDWRGVYWMTCRDNAEAEAVAEAYVREGLGAVKKMKIPVD